MSRFARAIVLVPLLAAIAGTVACRPALVVRISTVVFADGSLSRRLELVGRTSEGEIPTDDDWFESSAGLRLADPDAWARVDRRPDRLYAEGVFLGIDELPGGLAFDTDRGARRERTRTELELDDGVILRRRVYRESHGDPFSNDDSAAALDALIELAAEALRRELQLEFGPDFDTQPAEELLWGKGRSLASALLGVHRSASGWDNIGNRPALWSRILADHGVPAIDPGDPLDYWDEQLPVLLAWARQEVAWELSTEESPVRAEELDFWPMGDDYEFQATEIVERVWGGEDELFARIEPHLAALGGYYAGQEVPRFLFEMRVELPGVLLETNGTPDDAGIVWLFRERELSYGDQVLSAETVELDDEALTAMGARREFDRAHLLQLSDLLFTRDPDGVIADLLRRAVREGDLGVLRDETAVPDELKEIAGELAALLDPELPLREPL